MYLGIKLKIHNTLIGTLKMFTYRILNDIRTHLEWENMALMRYKSRTISTFPWTLYAIKSMLDWQFQIF